MDISFETKFIIVLGLCVCPVILFVSMPVFHTHSRKMNPSEKLINIKTAERVPAKNLESRMKIVRKTRRIPDFVPHADPNITSLRRLLAVCIKAVKAGGIKLQEIRKKYDVGRYSKIKRLEDAVNPVISGKHHSYKTMYTILKKSFPELKIVSRHGYNTEFMSHGEELPELPPIELDESLEDVDVSTKDVLVWVDPLDGSKEYHDNNLEYVSTMVCVAVKGKPVIGVIHQPFENVTMWGWDGNSNATLLGSMSEQSCASSPTLITSSLHALELKVNANIALGYDVNVIAASGAGYKILQLAVGNADAYIHAAPIKKWDICAGHAIIRALNGNMTAFNGEEVDYGNYSDVTQVGGVFGTISFHENYFDITPAENSTSYSDS